MIESITLLGSSSGRNAGDAALIGTIMDSIDAACGQQLLYEIPTMRPDFIWKTYSNRVRAVPILPWNLSAKLLGVPTYRSLLRTDLSLVFDATLFDRSLYNPFFNFLSSYSLLLPSAKRKGKKLGCFNVSAGPVSTPMGRRMLREVAELMDFITVRDEGSMRVLQEVGVDTSHVLVTADAALNTRQAPEERVDEILRELGLDPEQPILGVNINAYRDTWATMDREPMQHVHFMAVYAEAITRALRDIGENVLFVSTQHLDNKIAQELIARTRPAKKAAFLSNAQYSHTEIKGVLSRLSLLVGMRLHCLILGSSAHTPIVSLNYLPKVRHYVDSLGLGEYCMDFEDFHPDRFLSYILKGWENRQQIRAVLQSRIPTLQREANKSAELVAAMRAGADPLSFIEQLRVSKAG
ncbi:MAG: polysaccharide pyruvyl transferase family protein [Deltaproteobacteria bacterium]|nr:polysaccharide pyruvyl transferase family protein [Deltaproteobacteria bacterium]